MAKNIKLLKIFAIAAVLLMAIPAVLAGSITPSTPYTIDSLSAVESEPEQYTFKWYKNGEFVTSGQTLDSSNTGKGEVWRVEYWLNMFGQMVDLAEVTILNTIPTVPVVYFTLDPYIANSTVTVTATSTDVDNDALTYTYVFSNSSIQLQNSTANTYVCAGSCPKGDNLTVEVWAFDGDDFASSSTANSTLIENAVPYITSVSSTPASVYVGSLLNATGNATDIDNDGLTYTYEFVNANTSAVLQAYSSSNLYNISSAAAHSAVEVFVNASDGLGSNVGSANFTVLNSDPVWSVTDLSGYQDIDTVVDISQYASDADGDGLIFYNTNSDNITGVVLAGNLTLTPDTGYFGSQLLNLTADDGYANVTQEVNVTIIPNTAPTVHYVNITSNPTSNDGSIDCMFFANDTEDTNLTVYYSWFRNSTLLSSDVANLSDLPKEINTNASSILRISNYPRWENWTCGVIVSDGIVNSTAINSTTVTIANGPPLLLSSIGDQSWAQNQNLSLNLTSYFEDRDGDDLNYTSILGNNMTAHIDNSTGMAILEPDTDFVGTSNVTFTAIDDYGASVNTSLIVLSVGFSNVIDSWINGTFYAGDLNYTNISGVFVSFINISTVTGPTISIVNSNLTNATITDSTLDSCTVIDTLLMGATCVNAYIDPSDVRYSDTTGSNVYDSVVWYTNATNSFLNNTNVYNSTIDLTNMTDSTFTNVTMTGSYVFNSTMSDTTISDANITSDVLYSGTMLMSNGSLYNATASGQQNLTELVNYAPSAVISSPANGASFTTGNSVSFVDASTDTNLGGMLNDSLTYFWLFGDGTNATTANASHTYSSDGSYIVSLTVTDAYGEGDAASIGVSTSTPSSGSSSSGSSGSSRSSTVGVQYIYLVGEQTLSLGRGNQVEFNFGGDTHKATLNEIYSTFVKVTVQSEPVTAMITEGESAKFDLNSDGYYDLELTLEDLSSYSVNLKFKVIMEKVPQAEEVSEEVIEDSEEETIELVDTETEGTGWKAKWNALTGKVSSSFDTVKDKSSDGWERLSDTVKKWYVNSKAFAVANKIYAFTGLGVLVLAVLISLFVLKKKRKGKKYKITPYEKYKAVKVKAPLSVRLKKPLIKGLEWLLNKLKGKKK